MKNAAKFLLLIVCASLFFTSCELFELNFSVFSGTKWEGQFYQKVTGAVDERTGDSELIFSSTGYTVSGKPKGTGTYKEFLGTYEVLPDVIYFDTKNTGTGDKEVDINGSWSFKFTASGKAVEFTSTDKPTRRMIFVKL